MFAEQMFNSKFFAAWSFSSKLSCENTINLIVCNEEIIQIVINKGHFVYLLKLKICRRKMGSQMNEGKCLKWN